MGQYILKVIPTAECSKEYTPDKELVDGVECDGYLTLQFRKGEICACAAMGVSIEMLQEYLRKNEEVGSIILQAAEIAEGYIRAVETLKKSCDKKSGHSIIRDLIIDAIKEMEKAEG